MKKPHSIHLKCSDIATTGRVGIRAPAALPSAPSPPIHEHPRSGSGDGRQHNTTVQPH